MLLLLILNMTNHNCSVENKSPLIHSFVKIPKSHQFHLRLVNLSGLIVVVILSMLSKVSARIQNTIETTKKPHKISTLHKIQN